MSQDHQSQSPKIATQVYSPLGQEEEAKPLFKYSYDRYKSQKPRRNKSAFLLFSSEKRALLKANGENLNSNQMMGKLAELWNNLPPEERRRFDSEAIEEKKRYLQELEAFKKENPSIGGFHNKTKRNHIKKPCSAYGLFLKEATVHIKKEHPDLLMADVLKIVSERWKSLNEGEKQRYEERAKKEKNLSQAKQLEKITKHVKIEAASTGTTELNDHSSSDTYYKQEELPEEQSMPQEQPMPQEPIRSPNYGIIVNEWMPALSSYISSQFDLVLIPKLKQPSSSLFQPQNSLFMSPGSFNEVSGASTDSKSQRTVGNEEFRTLSDMSIEIPKLGMNPIKQLSSSPFNLSSIRLNSHPFSSVNNFRNSSLSGNYANPARQEALNSVLRNVLNMNP